jgi:hypothetical protein
MLNDDIDACLQQMSLPSLFVKPAVIHQALKLTNPTTSKFEGKNHKKKGQKKQRARSPKGSHING